MSNLIWNTLENKNLTIVLTNNHVCRLKENTSLVKQLNYFLKNDVMVFCLYESCCAFSTISLILVR